MENAIEICSGCGKMPRSIDTSGGQFVCIRCGNRTTMQVTTEDYEKVVSELDARFHSHVQRQKLASARS
jgi:DNA-directed RNA polymerase subunit RPC12/RpoP